MTKRAPTISLDTTNLPPRITPDNLMRALRETAAKEQEYADDDTYPSSAAVHTAILMMLERLMAHLEKGGTQ